MNKNKKIIDLTSYKHKNTFDNNKNIISNIHPIHPDKKTTFDLSLHKLQNKIKDNDFKDITNIVRNSVEKINNLFNQTELKTKKYIQKTSKELKFEISDIDENDEFNKSSETKKKERSNTLEKSSKANFTFNINNFINVPNISTTLPNISQIKPEKSENHEKINLRNAAINAKNNRIYLNNINNKKNLLIEHKGLSSHKKLNNLIENNNNYSSINDSLFQIDEVQTNNNKKSNMNTSGGTKMNNYNNAKNIKISVLNSRASKTNYNMNINKVPELSKSIKEVKESGTNTPLQNESNSVNMTLSGLTTINEKQKVIYKMPANKKKEKDNYNLGTAHKSKYHNQPINRANRYKQNQNLNNNNQNNNQNNNNKNTNKNNLKQNNDINKNKQVKNKNTITQSRKLFKSGDNFYPLKKPEKEKDKIELNNNNDLNKNSNDRINFKSKKNIENLETNYQQTNYNITVKTMDDDINTNKINNINTNNNKRFKKNIKGNISDRESLANSPIETKQEKNKRRGCSIPYERRKSDLQEKDASRHSSSRLFHQVVNVFYSKEFPNKINTNEILKLMLFLNEYLINNNLLNDYYNIENKKLLEDYSKYISSKIKVDFPQEHDIVVDPSIRCVKKIQRKWRKVKIDKYLEKNKKNEMYELKNMIVNKYIKKSGYKIKKILGLFNTIVENFDNINKQPDINELFYQIQKLIHNKLTEYEKNLLYKEFINSIILNNNYNI